MRSGLRLQILLVLGVLMVLGLGPLVWAVSSWARLTLTQAREASAVSLARAVAGHVLEARRGRSASDLGLLMEADIGAEGVEAIGVYHHDGSAVVRRGEPSAAAELPAILHDASERVAPARSVHGSALAVTLADAEGAVVVVVRVDAGTTGADALTRGVALYTGLAAVALLLGTYFALTRWMVRPVEALSHAARRVAGGARRLEVPRGGSRELAELGESLRTMTERLLENEEALAGKVAEVERKAEELRQAQDTLIRSERLASTGRLAAGLAHEVGNPLSALIGLEDLLLSGDLGQEEQRDFLLRMRRETERIHRILRDLLQFARGAPDAGGEGVVETAVHETLSLLSPQRALQQVDMAIDVEPDLPPVTLSTERLVQVVLNLVLNAVDAAGPGARIEIAARSTERGVRLTVSDDGPGVAVGVRDVLFEPFVTTKEPGKGTGLGLAVCRGLVEGAGGTIVLDASHASGACFRIDLPRATGLRQKAPC